MAARDAVDEQAGAVVTGRKVRGLDANQRRKQRRDDLLAAALRLFAEQGHPNVSIEQICQTAYVSTKSFYDLFDSKEECFLALFEQLSATVEDCIGRALREVKRAGPDRIDDVLAGFVRHLAADPHLLTVTFGESASISPAVDRQRRINRRHAATVIEHIWRDFGLVTANTEAIRPIAVGAIGGLFDIISDWLHDHDPALPEHVAVLRADLITYHRALHTGLTAS